MTIQRRLICSSHTISGVLPGGLVPARHSFDSRVEACAAAGYTGMCLHFRDYSWQREAGLSNAELRATLESNGMHEISLEFLVDWFLDGSEGEQARANERTAYEAADAYRARSLNVGSDFRGLGIPRSMLRAKFRELCERAGERDLSIALEIVAWSDVRDVDTALQLVENIPNAGLVIDSWHVFRGQIPLSDIRRIPAEKILCIQLNDAEAAPHGSLSTDTLFRKLCGEGTFNLRGFLDALDSTGSTVPISVEIISPDFAALDLETAAHRSYQTAVALLGLA
ncbi:sugar phosphate isomerase/epimerase [Corticibacterium sp. UT-5YL-CI-8]|nr:sugar phosphate isomerase/epimerase [Tianweitania sp. UT-5YL-CI-8]